MILDPKEVCPRHSLINGTHPDFIVLDKTDEKVTIQSKHNKRKYDISIRRNLVETPTYMTTTTIGLAYL